MSRPRIQACARFLIALLPATPVAALGQSTVPRVISHQGYLTDASTGDPVSDASYDITFRLYEAPAGGSHVWTETQVVATHDGVFHAILGSVAPLDPVLFNGELWLSVQVESDSEMTDRIKLTSVPYAMGLALPFADTVLSSAPLLQINNAGGGAAIRAETDGSGPAIFAKDGRVEIEYNSALGDPHVLIRETSPGDYARLSLRNDDNALFWDMAAGGSGNSQLNFFREGLGDVMSLQNSGRVGIGTLAPDERLHVNGVVKADSVVYNSPLQGWASVHGSSFMPFEQDGTITYVRGNLFYYNGGTVIAAIAPIQLPHNAKLETISCRIYDFVSADDLECKLCREAATGCNPLGSVTSSGSGGLNTYTAPLTSSITVDNQIESFFIIASTASNTNWASYFDSLTIKGVSIGYTISGAP